MSDPFAMFLLVWLSAFCGACISEYVRRRWESRKRTDRLPSSWQPRTNVRGRR